MLLPNYLKRSGKKGNFSFRISVPEALRQAIGKREIKRSLKTSDRRKAMLMAMKLYEDTQRQFHSKKPKGCQEGTPIELYEEAVQWLKGLGVNKIEMERPQTTKEEDEAASRFAVADSLIDKVQDGEGTPLDGYKIEALQGTIKQPIPSVKDAVNLYLSERNGEATRTKANNLAFKQMVKRYEKYLIASLEEDKPLTSVNRADARSFRDYLAGQKDKRGTKKGFEKALKPGSINKAIQIISAIFTLAIREWEIKAINPFAGLKVEELESRKDKRRSFTDAELAAYLSALDRVNIQAKQCAILMVYTGARTGEIGGLEAQDVHLEGQIPHIIIRPNGVRQLKTPSSKRTVPLIGEALNAATIALRAISKGKPESPLFSRYGRPRGQDALSAVLMKVIRGNLKIKDPKLVAYSARHTMKDKLRNGLVQPDLQDAIMGHSRGQVSEGYGDGYWLPRLSEALLLAYPPVL